MSTSPHLIHLADIAPQPWRNGAGRTRELLAWPSADDWLLRLSVAEITRNGPFSRFVGVQRWFAVIAGAGVAVTVDGLRHAQAIASPPLCFEGDASTHADLLDGPSTDLNLMLRAGTRGSMALARAGQDWLPGSAGCGLFSAAGGICKADDQPYPLPAWALLWFEQAPATLRWLPAAPTSLYPVTGWWLAASLYPVTGWWLAASPPAAG